MKAQRFAGWTGEAPCRLVWLPGAAMGAADVAAQKKRITDSQAAIEKATQAIADGEKTIVEAKAALTKLEPQLPPLRDRVKHLTDQYLAMLPK